MTSTTTSQAFFDAMYQNADDPWKFATDPYELCRYDRIMQALADRHFALAYEPGCSVGVLTERLAARCDRLEACDLSPLAVERARLRCQGLANVQIHRASLDDFAPRGADLYVFSEVGYYRTHTALAALMQHHVDALAPEATLIACHWRGFSPDHVLSGDEVHEILRETRGLVHEYSQLHKEFRLDSWAKREAEDAPHNPYRRSHSGPE